MSFKKLGIASLILTGFAFNPAVNAQEKPTPPTAKTPDAELRDIRDRASADPLLKYWLEALQNGAIKHGLDRGVDVNLRSSEIAQGFYRNVMKDVDEVIYEYRVNQLKTSALAQAGSHGQYQDLLKVTQEVAEALGFPPEARANIHLYISGQQVVNAYTYSGTTDVIEVVVYEGLLDLMKTDPGAVRQVIGHELGHIKSGHIRNRLLLLAVFNAYADDLIPDPEILGKDKEPTDPKATEKKALVEQAIYDQAKLLIGGEPLSQANLDKMLSHASSALLLHASPDIAEVMARDIVERVQDISDTIRSKTTRQQRRDLTNSVLDTVLNYGVEESAQKKEPREPDFKELKDFMAKLDGILSRAQEISSDRYGMLATKNEKDSIMAYVRMTGGKGATIEGMLAQQEELDLLELNNPASLVEDGSHPVIGERAVQFAEFSKHPGFLIYSQSYLQAIYEYLSLSQLIHQGDVAVGKDVLDLSAIHHARWKREKAIVFAQELSTWIEKQVMTEVSGAVTSPDPSRAEFKNFRGLLDLLEMFTTGGKGLLEVRLFADWVKDLSRSNRLVANLVTQLSALAASQPEGSAGRKVATKAVEALKAAAPGFEGQTRKASANFMAEIGKKDAPTKGGKTPCEKPLT